MNSRLKKLSPLPASLLALGLMLTSSLTFAESIVKPTLTITAPKNDAETTNGVFLVKGDVAKGTWALSNVLVSVNAGAWTAAGVSNTTWNIGVGLTPGTNTIAAYAADVAGNVSATGTVKLLYAVPALFTLQIAGEGKVTPDHNGQKLDLGVDYTQTAKGTNGCAFVYWSELIDDIAARDGVKETSGGVFSHRSEGVPVNTNSTFTFTMRGGLSLTAHFRDITPPTLTITTPKAGENYSNSTIAVTGTAKDNVAVAAVNVRVNGSGWVTASGTTAWGADVSLSPGTNVVAAYAVDTAGNTSITNEVKVFYADRAPLTLQIDGEGTVTPATNGQALDLGVNYTLTAKGTNGCVFGYWSGGVPMTTNSKVAFTMTNGLSITAHFEDVTPPTLVISAPTAGENYSNTTITVTGTAKDNVGVAEVNLQINGGGWVTAAGTTAWSAALPVVSGANTVEAYAEDAAGNCSKTNTVQFKGYPPQANWAPTGVVNSLILMEPIFPSTGAPHHLCFSAKNFTYSDTNTLSPDSGIGVNYFYNFVDTNCAVVQLAFSAPPAVSGDTAALDLAFTNFNVGWYTNYSNEAANETGVFSIVPVQQLAPTNWSGKSYLAQPANGLSSETWTFTSETTFSLKRTGTLLGTYVVDNASPIGALFTADVTNTTTMRTLYLQATFTSATNGFYEDNEYTNGTLDAIEIGTFH